jgi:plasmid stabilization system protein ParE
VIVHYEPAAREEVVAAARWYVDVAGDFVADAFEIELHTAVQLLVRFPQLGTPGVLSTRNLRLNGFPYTLHYRLTNETITILALAHQRRRPGYWRSRA